MDSLDQLIQDYSITKQKVLDLIGDEWSVICYYLSEAYGIEDFEPELRKAYRSPIRNLNSDDKPSFSIWIPPQKRRECEYLWKDSGLAEAKVGDLFQLVKEIYNLRSLDEVYRKMDRDLGLDLFENNQLETKPIIKRVKPPEKKEPAYIRITSKEWTVKGLAYWAKYGITKSELEREGVYEVQYFWTTKSQSVPYTPQSLCFAYREKFEGVSYYKLYQPFNKEFKFINDYPDFLVEGWNNLKYEKDLLIITKSRKDCIVLHSLGYEAVSPKSETTLIHDDQMDHLISRYAHIIILFDNDGKHNGEMYKQRYKLSLVFIPKESETKDISDFREKYGAEESIKLLKELTNEI